MPRPGPRRKPKTIRLSDPAIAEVEEVATREQEEWSEAARLLLAYAGPRMPEGWRPEQESARR